jgi:hypothetical protein
MVQGSDVGGIFPFVVAVFFFFVAAEEKVDGCALHFDNRMETSQSNDRYGLCVGPGTD